MKIQNGIPLKAPVTADQRDGQLREAAKMYEQHFLSEMVKSMRKTTGGDDNGLIKKNMGEKIFAEQLDGQYVEQWANKGGVGIADMIYNQIKEKYYDTTKRDFSPGHRTLPIAPKREPAGIPPSDSLKMKMIPSGSGARLEYRFEVPDASGSFDAVAPLDGRVVESTRMGDDWNLVKLDHGQGLTSEMTFPGGLATIGTGEVFRAGQKFGTLDRGRPVLAWKLDWMNVDSQTS